MKFTGKNRPTFISFFHGVGGMSIGAQRAGWRPILATDNWSVAELFHHMNYPNERFLNLDFEELDIATIMNSVSEGDKDLIADGGLDCIVSGSPCQGMSEANMKRNIFDCRNYLMLKQITLAAELRPKVMWFEQVPGFLDPVMKPLYTEVMAVLRAQSEYSFSLKVLNAIDYKSNQSRNRVTIIMVRKDVGIPSFPKKNKVDLSMQSVGSLLDGITQFKKKPGGGINNAFENVAPTLVASNEGMRVFDSESWSALSIQQRLILSNLSDHNFDGLKDSEIVRLAGNMVQIPFAEAIMKHIKTTILLPYYMKNELSHAA